MSQSIPTNQYIATANRSHTGIWWPATIPRYSLLSALFISSVPLNGSITNAWAFPHPPRENGFARPVEPSNSSLEMVFV